jgi:hypothetical protein
MTNPLVRDYEIADVLLERLLNAQPAPAIPGSRPA